MERLAMTSLSKGGLHVGQPLNPMEPAWSRMPLAVSTTCRQSLGMRLKPAAIAVPRLRLALTEALCLLRAAGAVQ